MQRYWNLQELAAGLEGLKMAQRGPGALHKRLISNGRLSLSDFGFPGLTFLHSKSPSLD